MGLGYTPAVTGSMRNRVRGQGIETPRGACDGWRKRNLARKCWRTPSPGVFASADSKGVTRGVSVSADYKGLICTKIVQNTRFYGSAESKGVRGVGCWRVGSR